VLSRLGIDKGAAEAFIVRLLEAVASFRPQTDEG
jgi:hypothetical protein